MVNINYREPDHSVNRGQKTDIKKAFKLFLKICIAIVLLVSVINVTISSLVKYIPFSYEQKLAGLFDGIVSDKVPENGESINVYFATLAQKIIQKSNKEIPDLKFSLLCTKMPNALTLPGGRIYLTSGLVDEMSYEDELFFVIGHEIGHVIARDNLKALVGLVWEITYAFTLQFVLSSDTEAILSTLNLFTSRGFDRKQELAADRFALNALAREYKSVNAAQRVFELFSKLEEEHLDSNNIGIFGHLTLTHPLAEKRIERVAKLAGKKGWSVQNLPSLSLESLQRKVAVVCS